MSYLDDTEETSGNYLIDHWRGHHSLGRSYWINGVLVSSTLAIATLALAATIDDRDWSLQVGSMIALLLQLVLLAAAVWIIVGVWRSAGRHTENGGTKFWAVVARIMVGLALLGQLAQLPSLFSWSKETALLAIGWDPMGSPALIETFDDRLLITGALSLGTADKAAKAIAAAGRIRELHLNSEGGRIAEAERIAQIVRERRLDTVVVEQCQSACTLILLAGRNRSAMRGSFLGFHRPYYPGVAADELQRMANEMGASYSEAGVSEQFIGRVLNTDPEDMLIPSEQELFEAGILNSVHLDRVAADNQAAAKELNGEAPMVVDEYTRLESAVADGPLLTFHYSVALSRSRLAANFEDIMIESLTGGICANPDAARLLNSHGVYRYLYRDSAGRVVADFEIDNCLS